MSVVNTRKPTTLDVALLASASNFHDWNGPNRSLRADEKRRSGRHGLQVARRNLNSETTDETRLGGLTASTGVSRGEGVFVLKTKTPADYSCSNDEKGVAFSSTLDQRRGAAASVCGRVKYWLSNRLGGATSCRHEGAVTS